MPVTNTRALSSSVAILLTSCVLLLPLAAFAQNPEATPVAEPPVIEKPQEPQPEPSEFQGLLDIEGEYEGKWSARVDAFVEQIILLEKNEEDADELYLDLGRALRIRQGALNRILNGARSPLEIISGLEELPPTVRTIDDLHASVESLYTARLQLLRYISPALQLEATGTDVFGVDELAAELQFIWLQIRFQVLYIPAASKELWRRIAIAPLPLIWRLLEFVLAIIIFRWWRRWFPETLRKMRASLTDIRPRSEAILRRIKAIWYVDQLRRPVEWWILFSVIFALINMAGVNYITDILKIIVSWLLLGWFAVAMLHAVAARGAAGLAGENARLRQRSLRLVATWMVLLGLGLDIADSLAGVATLHAWVWRLFQIVAIPLAIVLLSWWRESIFVRLEREQDTVESLEGLLQYRTGFRSYARAAQGAVWLMANALRRSMLRNVLRMGSEQGFSSSLVTGKAEPPNDAAPDESVFPLPDVFKENLLARGKFYDRYARSERREIITLARNNRNGVIAISGERGIGMTSVLEQIGDALDKRMILVSCNSGKFEDLERDIAAALDIRNVNAKKVSQALVESGIHTIAVDNLHRLVRPVMGGQSELSRLSSLIESIHEDVLWVFSVDRFAWQFMRRVRADRSAINEVIELRSWSEEQIAELLDMRTTEAGMDVDFGTVKIPREFMETTLNTVEERNKAGVFRMICTMSGGNPAVALRIWTDTIYADESAQLHVRTPTQAKSRELDKAPQNTLLVLRVIAQWELISEADIVDNLRLPQGAVSSAVHYCVQRGWIEKNDKGFSLTWGWFRTINRALLRQNLLAR